MISREKACKRWKNSIKLYWIPQIVTFLSCLKIFIFSDSFIALRTANKFNDRSTNGKTTTSISFILSNSFSIKRLLLGHIVTLFPWDKNKMKTVSNINYAVIKVGEGFIWYINKMKTAAYYIQTRIMSLKRKKNIVTNLHWIKIKKVNHCD